MEKQLKNQEEWDKAWSDNWNLKTYWWEYIEMTLIIIGSGIISMYLSFGNMVIAIILGFIIMMCFLSGKPINLKKYLPSDKRIQREKKEFNKVYWKTILMEIDDKKKRNKVADVLAQKGYYKSD